MRSMFKGSNVPAFRAASVSDVAKMREAVAMQRGGRGGAGVGGPLMQRGGAGVGDAFGQGYIPGIRDQGYGFVSNGSSPVNPLLALQQIASGAQGPQAAAAAQAALAQANASQLPGGPGAGAGMFLGNNGFGPMQGWGPNGPNGWPQGQIPAGYPGCNIPWGPADYCSLYPSARGLQFVEFGVSAGATPLAAQ